MTDHYDEMRVAPDHSQAEALRQRLHARMASVSRDDRHGRADLDVAIDHFDPDELDPSKEMYMTVDSPTSGTGNRKRVLMAAAAVVVAVGVAGIALATSNTDDDDQTPSSPSVATVAPTTTVAPDLSAGSPGLVTGQLLDKESTPPAEGPMWQEDVAVDGGFRQRVRESHGTSEMSDARLSGSVTLTDNADRFGVENEIFADVLWGTIVIENDQGTWTGRLTGTGDLSTDFGVSYIELVGAGAYEGLSAIIFERETPTTFDWNGVIFSGNLPPDR